MELLERDFGFLLKDDGGGTSPRPGEKESEKQRDRCAIGWLKIRHLLL